MARWRLVSWNVNGIRAASRKGFTKWLRRVTPNVLCLQEIKLSEAARAKTEFDFAGYEEYWHPAARAGYSGTAMLTNRTPRQVTNGLGVTEIDAEGRVQTLEFADFVLVNAYFPNSSEQLKRLPFKLRFNDEYLRYVKKLKTESGKPLVLTGDFNVAHREIDLARPKDNIGNPGFTAEERCWVDRLLAAGFVDSFRLLHGDEVKYSWWSYRSLARERNIGWRIDYFFISEELRRNVIGATIGDEVSGSDHAPVGLELEL